MLPEAPALAPSPVQVAQAPPNEASDDVLAALRNELDNQDWQNADRETRQLLNQWIHPNGHIFAHC
ncbi:hypothetical protein [Vacuolonema iberomarrocanum]|uniref:hypothetical protein n=1 Tax=Vacuolonema iberomarrocanum TaxID=3454632 RepID=UPI0019D880DB|nr:hypothetical protein [filamentous cyanobacterium LEGE 07170]